MQPQTIQPTGKITGRTKAALWLLIGPTALLVAAFILFAVTNWVFGATTTQTDELFAEPSMITTIINVVLFLAGALSVLTWLPGLIVGIILLATRPSTVA